MLNTHKSVSAKMSGSTLVVSFQKSTPPLIWKFDLEKNHSFTVALQGEDNDLQLGVNSSRGEFTPIAHFSDRDSAEEAFMALQEILMKKQRGLGTTVLAVLGGVFIIMIVVGAIGKIVTSTQNKDVSAGPQQITPGVAVPADKVLQPPPMVPTEIPR
jgi:hypothetical protein